MPNKLSIKKAKTTMHTSLVYQMHLAARVNRVQKAVYQEGKYYAEHSFRLLKVSELERQSYRMRYMI